MQEPELSPEETTRNLVHAGLFLVAFELIKQLVVKRVESFYNGIEYGPGGPFKNYKADVLVRHKHVFEASLLYLRDHFEAISAEDLDAIQRLREYRNEIAHNLPTMLGAMDPVSSEALLVRARESLFRLSNFWVYIDVGADPEFRDTDWKTVYGSDLVLLDRIIDQTHSLRAQ